MWAAPAVLCGLVLAIGLAPMALAGGLVAQAAQAVTGQPVTVHLALWHGADAPALWLSLAAVGGGLIWLGAERRLQRLPVWPEAADLFDNGLRALIRAAQAATAAQRDGRLTRLMAVVVCMAAGLAAVAWITAPVASPVVGWPALPPLAPALVWLGLAAPVLALPVLHAQRYLALILLGLVGLVVSAGFVWLSAPDLALTQISVEVVTVILLLLALHILPSTARPDPLPRRLRDAMLAGLAGLGLGAISLLLLTRPPLTDPISAFHLAQSVPGAGGANAVNTIIVDFRGYDTYGEILVLAIAGLIIVAVADGLRGVKVPGRQHPDAGDPHPVMFTVASRLLLPLVLTVGVHLFLRGHNLPGGGFVAGLVFAIALVMQWLASGLAWTQRRQRLKGHALIGAGALIATTIGVWPMLGGRPFLSSDHGHVDLPVLHSVELATAMLFDLGVFLCVLGAVVLALQAIARLPRPQES